MTNQTSEGFGKQPYDDLIMSLQIYSMWKVSGDHHLQSNKSLNTICPSLWLFYRAHSSNIFIDLGWLIDYSLDWLFSLLLGCIFNVPLPTSVAFHSLVECVDASNASHSDQMTDPAGSVMNRSHNQSVNLNLHFYNVLHMLQHNDSLACHQYLSQLRPR